MYNLNNILKQVSIIKQQAEVTSALVTRTTLGQTQEEKTVNDGCTSKHEQGV